MIIIHYCLVRLGLIAHTNDMKKYSSVIRMRKNRKLSKNESLTTTNNLEFYENRKICKLNLSQTQSLFETIEHSISNK